MEEASETLGGNCWPSGASPATPKVKGTQEGAFGLQQYRERLGIRLRRAKQNQVFHLG